MLDTCSATDFKATCLDLLDQVSDGTLERVVVTKRGKVVGILCPPDKDAAPEDVFGCMRGSVSIPADLDLTDPVDAGAFDAESGTLHR